MNDRPNILQTIAEALGEGWTAQPYDDSRDDGYMTGPHGETYHVDARAFGEYPEYHKTATFSLKHRTRLANQTTRIDFNTEGDETLEDFIAVIKETLPALEQAREADLAQVEAVSAPALAFAVEVAGFMEPGWAGGVEYGGLDELRVKAFVQKGNLRVGWTPFTINYDFHTLKTTYNPVQRLRIEGLREHEKHDTGFYDYDNNPSITMAANRGAKAIAGEITRRVLPGYIAAMEKADAEMARHHKAVAEADATVEKARKAMAPVVLREYTLSDNNECETRKVDFYENVASNASVHGDLTCSPGRVSLELHAYSLDEAAMQVLLKAVGKAVSKLKLKYEEE